MKFGKHKTKKDSKVDLASITGTYQDKWFGDVVISEKGVIFLPLNVLLSLAASVFIKKEIMW
jgi:hypothetical protein